MIREKHLAYPYFCKYADKDRQGRRQKKKINCDKKSMKDNK